MLMQSFLSAEQLGISEEQKAALVKTLVLLETGKLTHVPPPRFEDYIFDTPPAFTAHFNMATWGLIPTSCGTIACIAGTAEIIGSVKFIGWRLNPGLFDLFEPQSIQIERWCDITTTQATRALRSYLNCGDAKWNEAVAPSSTRSVPVEVES